MKTDDDHLLIKTKIPHQEFLSVALLILFLLAILFGELLFNPKIMFTGNDLIGFFWSAYRFYHDQVISGNGIPFWYSFHSTGVPMLGNPELLPFYPLYWLNFFFPTSLALSLIAYFSLFLTGIFGYTLAKKVLHLSFGTSVFFSVTLVLTPKLYGHLYAGHIGLITSYPYVILLILTYLHLFQKPKILSSVYLALSVALLYFAGGVQALFYTIFLLLLLSVIYLVQLFFTSKLTKILNDARHKLPYLAFATTLTIGLTAFQLTIASQHTALSQRTGLQYTDAAFLPVTDLPQALFFGGKNQNWEALLYLGFFPALLLPLGLLFKNRLKWAALLIASLTLGFAYGPNLFINIHKFFFDFVPGFNYFRVPGRILFEFIPFALVLAAFGLEWLRTHPLFRKYSHIIIVTVTILTSLQLLMADDKYVTPIPSPDSDPQITQPAEYFKNFNSSTPPERAYATYHNIPEPIMYLAGSQINDGVENLYLNSYAQFMRLAGNYTYNGFSNSIPPSQIYGTKSLYHEEPTPDANLMGLLNNRLLYSTYKLTSPDFEEKGKISNLIIYENKKLLPRAFMIYNTQISTDLQDLKKFDASKTILLPVGSQELKSDKQLQPIPIISYKPNSISLQVPTKETGYLFLSEVYYPDWVVYVDGQKSEIVKADHLFRSVLLPPGNHQVEFKYLPFTFSKISVWISCFSLLLIVGIFIYSFSPLKKRLKLPWGII